MVRHRVSFVVTPANDACLIFMQYDDWLRLPEISRDRFHRDWDVYQHEMFWVPMMAAARLASQSHLPVSDLYAGIWHGGEYVLHLTVPRQSLSSLPAPLEQTFEGFRVIWIGDNSHIECPKPFLGKWQTAGDYGHFEIYVTDTNGKLAVDFLDLHTQTSLDVISAKVHLNQLSFTTQSNFGALYLYHCLDLDSGEKFNYSVTGCQIARRIR